MVQTVIAVALDQTGGGLIIVVGFGAFSVNKHNVCLIAERILSRRTVEMIAAAVEIV